METASTHPTVALGDVDAARRGDQTAFARLVEATCTLVSSIALAIVRDPDVSRDITQDVFLAAWHDIRKLREASSFLPWLRQITLATARITCSERLRDGGAAASRRTKQAGCWKPWWISGRTSGRN